MLNQTQIKKNSTLAKAQNPTLVKLLKDKGVM